MSKKKKLLERIRNNPKDVSFDDLDKLLRWAGFVPREQKSGTSHFCYTRPGHPGILTIPRKNPLKEVYVKMALQVIEEHGDFEDGAAALRAPDR